jgi:hypothetical protein
MVVGLSMDSHIFSESLQRYVTVIMMMFISEAVADWIKHAFISKEGIIY